MGAKQSNGLWIVAGFHNANPFFCEFHGQFHMFVARKEFLENGVPGPDWESFHHATLHRKCVVLDQGGHCGIIGFGGGGDAVLDQGHGAVNLRVVIEQRLPDIAVIGHRATVGRTHTCGRARDGTYGERT